MHVLHPSDVLSHSGNERGGWWPPADELPVAPDFLLSAQGVHALQALEWEKVIVRIHVRTEHYTNLEHFQKNFKRLENFWPFTIMRHKIAFENEY